MKSGEIKRDEIKSPASPGQWKFWKVHQLNPNTNADNISFVIPVARNLPLRFLERALELLVARHEILRTSFLTEAGVLWQKIHREVETPTILLEIPGELEAFQASDRTADSLRKVLESSFVFSRAPLVRMAIVRFTAGKTQLVVLVTNHILVDSWSLGVLRKEFLKLLDSVMHGKNGLGSPVKQFRHVSEERNSNQVKRIDLQKKYWCRHLSGVNPRLSIPLDLPRGEVNDEKLRDEPINLRKANWLSCLELTRKEKYSIFTVITSCLVVALAEYATNGEIVIGSVYSNRALPENRGVIGPLFNVVPLRIVTKNNPTLRDLMRQVQRVSLRAYFNGEVAMEEIADELGFGKPVLGGGPPLWEVASNILSLSKGTAPSERVNLDVFHGWLSSIRRDIIMERWDGRILEIISRGWYGDSLGELRYNSSILGMDVAELISTRLMRFLEKAPKLMDAKLIALTQQL